MSFVRVALGVTFVALCLALYIMQPADPGSPLDATVTIEVGRLERDVRLISASSPRDYQNTENLDRVAAYIRAALAAAGGRVSDQTFTTNDRTYRNVVASFGPEQGERVVVGAHYDAFGPGPGADDNASGVAGLLELGRILGRTRMPTRVDLVAYTLEEPPYFGNRMMGSAVHARSLKAEGVALRCMIVLEMIGYFSDAENSQRYPSRLIGLLYPSKGNFIGIVGKIGGARVVRTIKAAMSGATDLPVFSLNAPRFVAGVDFSDHASYWDAGYQAVMITDTAFFRYEHYHTLADTPDRLDFNRMGKVVRGVHAAIVALGK